MTFDLAEIQQSKHGFRQCLAALPIVEKVAMLDALRERTLAIREALPEPESAVLREQSPCRVAQK